MSGKKEEASFFLASMVYKKRMAGLSRKNPKEYERLYNELHRYADGFSECYEAQSTGEDLFFRVLYEQIRWAAYKQRLQPRKFVKSLFDGYTDADSFMARLQDVRDIRSPQRRHP